MLKSLRKRSGDRYTLISILLILAMLYGYRFAAGEKQGDYPGEVYYNNQKYDYTETVKESSLKFTRKYGKSYEGYMLLVKRTESKKEQPEAVYIYASWRAYRKYQMH
jgi:hypothetical protein